MKIENGDITYNGQVIYALLPNVLTDTLLSTATPDVFGKQCLNLQGNVITVTNFLHPIDGQTIKLLGDGATTIANNTNIKTNTGSDKLLAAHKVYTFTYFQKVSLWVENA